MNDNASWKDALNSRPEGSFICPGHDVQDLLGHIDDSWTIYWEGTQQQLPRFLLAQGTL